MIYRFEGYVLDTDQRELRRGNIVCPVEPQVFDLLDHLIRNHNRAVSKEEVLSAIWPGKVVCEATLSSRVNAARSAIGDNGSDQRLIRTLRTKGFRFVGEVLTEEPVVPSIIAGDPGDEYALADHPALAVLPFVNTGDDPKREPFVDGLTEDLITELASSDWFFTASRNSTFACKGKLIESRQVARKLHVRYLLQGSVRLVADRQRICVHLVDALSDRNIWAKRYDAADPTTAQDDIVERVVTSVESLIFQAEQLRPERKSCEALNTWERTVRALSLMNTRQSALVENARALMQKATFADPRSARAHSLLSFITTLGVHQGWRKRHREIPCAQHMARTALCLNSEEPWAYLASGYAKIWVHPEEAISDLQKALTLRPGLAIGHYLLALACAFLGQGNCALRHGAMAEQLSPKDLLSRGNSGVHYSVRAAACFALGRYVEGMELARKATIESPGMPTAHRAFLINSALAGRREEAREALQKILRVAPSMSQSWLRESSVWTRGEDLKNYFEAFRIAGLKK